jgi:hypothetical protein
LEINKEDVGDSKGSLRNWLNEARRGKRKEKEER